LAEIVIKNLRKEFGAFTAVQGSTFTIGDGEFFMLLGPSTARTSPRNRQASATSPWCSRCSPSTRT
jgi:hypothetical protein